MVLRESHSGRDQPGVPGCFSPLSHSPSPSSSLCRFPLPNVSAVWEETKASSCVKLPAQDFIEIINNFLFRIYQDIIAFFFFQQNLFIILVLYCFYCFLFFFLFCEGQVRQCLLPAPLSWTDSQGR